MVTHTLKEADWNSFIAKEVLPLCVPGQSAKVFALVGDLGAGKTTFSKEFLRQLGVTEHIQSPTFSIINSYDISGSPIKSGMTENGFKKVFHMDVYRIEDIKELEILHIDDIFRNPEHIVVIEWADTIRQLIPEGATWIELSHDTPETRKILIHDAKN